MVNYIECLVIIILIGVAILLINLLLSRIFKKADDRQSRVAKRLNFRYEPPRGPLGLPKRGGKPHISGTYRGRSIRIGTSHSGDRYYEGGWHTPEHFSSIIIMDIENSSNSFMSLKHTEPLRPARDVLLSQAPGLIRIHNGHKRFETRFSIRSRPEDFAICVLQSPEIRDRLMGMNFPFNFHVRKNRLKFNATDTVDTTKKTYFMIFELLCDITDVIEEFRPSRNS